MYLDFQNGKFGRSGKNETALPLVKAKNELLPLDGPWASQST